MRRFVVATVLLAAFSLLAACDSGPSGPGEFTAVVTAPSGGVGAVILWPSTMVPLLLPMSWTVQP